MPQLGKPRSYAPRVFRVAGSLAILAALFAFIPFASLGTAFARASMFVFAVAFTVHFIAHLVAALKWRMLMGPDAGVSALTAFRAHFSGLVGNISPLGVVGGDIIRAGVVIKAGAPAGTVMVSSVMDRVIDTAALLVLMLIGVVWIGGRSAAGTTVLLWGLVLLAAGLTLSAGAFMWLRSTRSPPLARIRDAVLMALRQPGLIGRSLLLAVLIQGAFVTASAYIGSDIGVECSFAAWLVAWPASKIVAYLPISIGGIGVRESTLIALLRPFGGTPATVMAAGLLWQAALISGALFGWLLWSLLPGHAQSTARRTQAR